MFRINKDDVMIGISFPRYSTSTVDAVKFASNRGAKVIAITDSMASPVVKPADYVIIAKSDMASVVDSLVAPLSVINALIVATVLNKKDDVYVIFNDLENIWAEYEVYEKDREE